jgi:hypothetical protein
MTSRGKLALRIVLAAGVVTAIALLAVPATFWPPCWFVKHCVRVDLIAADSVAVPASGTVRVTKAPTYITHAGAESIRWVLGSTLANSSVQFLSNGITLTAIQGPGSGPAASGVIRDTVFEQRFDGTQQKPSRWKYDIRLRATIERAPGVKVAIDFVCDPTIINDDMDQTYPPQVRDYPCKGNVIAASR